MSIFPIHVSVQTFTTTLFHTAVLPTVQLQDTAPVMTLLWHLGKLLTHLIILHLNSYSTQDISTFHTLSCLLSQDPHTRDTCGRNGHFSSGDYRF